MDAQGSPLPGDGDWPDHGTPPPKMSPAPPPGRKFPCPACGAKLDFNPTDQALRCPYCGHVEDITPGDAPIDERCYETYLQKLSEEQTEVAGLRCEVRCPGCGAVVLMDENVATDRCPFCTTHLESKPEPAHALIPPESILPFRLDDRKARSAFNSWIAGLWFAPNSLRQLANLGQLSGLYLPYWTYDSMTASDYRGRRGDNYLVPVTYTTTDANGRRVTQTRMVVRTRWTSVGGHVRHFFDDVLIYASKGLPRDKVEELTPWDLENLTPYQPQYLSGFRTERYSVDLPAGFTLARTVMDGYIHELCRRDIGGDHQIVESVRTKHSGVTFKHLLLPIWLAAYRYNDKLYQIMVNARTGEVVGDRPYSPWKIAGTVLALVLAIAMIVLGVKMMQEGRASFGRDTRPDSPPCYAAVGRQQGDHKDAEARRKPPGRSAEFSAFSAPLCL